jgi:hypothetical protein
MLTVRRLAVSVFRTTEATESLEKTKSVKERHRRSGMCFEFGFGFGFRVRVEFKIEVDFEFSGII